MPEPLDLVEYLVNNPEAHQKAQEIVAVYHAVTRSLGELALSWAAMDAAIDEMFEPLLECSEAQVACILVENISARCEALKKLLYVEPLPEKWRGWVEALLNRVSGELAPLRNRYLHDVWRMTTELTKRRDKRAKIQKAQSRKKAALVFKTEHPTTVQDIERLEQRVSTVSLALKAATIALRLWRSEGQRPKLSRQWLPACKPNARMLNYQAEASALERPLVRLRYEFD